MATQAAPLDLGDDSAGDGAFAMVRRPVPAALAGLVTRITGYRETGRRMIAQTETASLTVPLVLSFGEPFEIGLGRAPEAADGQPSFAAGLFAGPVNIRSHGGAACLQVDFTPPGAWRFFGLPLSALADRMVPVADLDRQLAALSARLGSEPRWSRRFAFAERFLSERMAGGRPATAAVAFAYTRIVASGGRIPVAVLAADIGWSRKHLAARFREEIGTTPKAVARIARFKRAEAMAREGADGWAGIAAACGYADQAHLVREFGALAGATPGAWRAG